MPGGRSYPCIIDDLSKSGASARRGKDLPTAIPLLPFKDPHISNTDSPVGAHLRARAGLSFCYLRTAGPFQPLTTMKLWAWNLLSLYRPFCRGETEARKPSRRCNAQGNPSLALSPC